MAKERRPGVTEGELRFQITAQCVEDLLFLIAAELIAWCYSCLTEKSRGRERLTIISLPPYIWKWIVVVHYWLLS